MRDSREEPPPNLSDSTEPNYNTIKHPLTFTFVFKLLFDLVPKTPAVEVDALLCRLPTWTGTDSHCSVPSQKTGFVPCFIPGVGRGGG